MFVDRVTGPGGLPVGVSGRVVGPPVGRDRLAGRRAAGSRSAAARWSSCTSTRCPYLADTSQRKARDARRPAGAAPVLGPPLAGAVRRDPAGGRARRARAAPRGRLPPPHGEDRRGDRAEDGRARARDRREPRSGGLADPREHRPDDGGRRNARPSAAHRHGQGGDHPRGARHRDFRDLHRARPGLLHPVRPQASGDARVGRGHRGGRGAPGHRPARGGGTAGAASEAFRFPPVEAGAPLSAGS